VPDGTGRQPQSAKESRHYHLLRPPLDQIVDLGHPLVRLAKEIDWGFLDERFSSVCRSGPGQPPLPTRLVAGLLILKHLHDLSDEALCARWLENPYYQLFCGEESFQHRLPFERSSLSRWRQRLGGEGQLSALLQESLSVAHKTGALSAKDLERVAVDTTVQPKNIALPTDARLLHKAIIMLGRLAKKHDVPLRQSYVRVAKRAPYEFGCKVSVATPVTKPKGGQFVLHAKALHGNPYDGHTLGPIIADVQKLTGVEPRRIHVDKGYRGYNHPKKFRVWISGQVRRVTKTIRREMRRRAAIEPVIGHIKAEHRMERSYLKGRDGDRANAVLAAAGYNFSLLIRWLEALLRALLDALLRAAGTPQVV